MKIGIIGAGQIGGTLTRRFTQLGHDVFVANSRGPASLSEATGRLEGKVKDVEQVLGKPLSRR
jgi:8-hydroxy-5-deazaflavin:NADPH oxidoreductase